jgi:hypothetical protein
LREGSSSPLKKSAKRTERQIAINKETKTRTGEVEEVGSDPLKVLFALYSRGRERVREVLDRLITVN